LINLGQRSKIRSCYQMPVIKIDQISENRAVALWKITETLEGLLSVRPLSEYDYKLYER